jgi:acyl carrier protein
MKDVKSQLAQFVIENFLYGKANGFSTSDSFLESGVIDSTGMVELIFHLENEYGIHIEDSELVPENLDSVDRLAAFVERKQAVSLGKFADAS